ncbi:hypothetical protein D3C86_1803370 [compost metagenome]
MHLVVTGFDGGVGAADGLARRGRQAVVVQGAVEPGLQMGLAAFDRTDDRGLVPHQGVLDVHEGAVRLG